MIKLTFLGDIMFDNNAARELWLYKDRETGCYDFSDTFQGLRGLIKDSDYVIGNLETPISKDEQQLTNKQWEFCSPFEFADAIKKCGVDCVSTANNHCLDRGIAGIESTIDCLEKIGLEYCGIHKPNEKRRKKLLVTIRGVKFGILSYTYGTNAISNQQYLGVHNRRCVDLLQEQEGAIARHDRWLWYTRKHPRSIMARLRYKFDALFYSENNNKQWFEKITFNRYRLLLLKKDIIELKRSGADFVIMCMHIGGQYNESPSAYTKRMANWLHRHHCDIVIANHEHVIHGSEWKGKKEFTAYALGNCLGSAGTLHEPYNRLSNYSIAVHLWIDEKKEISKITFSVLKSILNDEGKFEVWPVWNLLEKCDDTEREKLIIDCTAAVNLFSGKNYQSIAEEYEL